MESNWLFCSTVGVDGNVLVSLAVAQCIRLLDRCRIVPLDMAKIFGLKSLSALTVTLPDVPEGLSMPNQRVNAKKCHGSMKIQ